MFFIVLEAFHPSLTIDLSKPSIRAFCLNIVHFLILYCRMRGETRGDTSTMRRFPTTIPRRKRESRRIWRYVIVIFFPAPILSDLVPCFQSVCSLFLPDLGGPDAKVARNGHLLPKNLVPDHHCLLLLGGGGDQVERGRRAFHRRRVCQELPRRRQFPECPLEGKRE